MLTARCSFIIPGMTEPSARVIGGGLAGCEAAFRLARAGIGVELLEMKPVRFSPAHQSPDLGELVCSNSLRSDDPQSAVGLLKEEMRHLGSLVMAAAERQRVPAGKALAVDREAFARWITERMASLAGVRVVRAEATDLDPDRVTVLATGPLTSPAMSAVLGELIGGEHLYFYDAIAPIVTAESLDMDRVFAGSRYGEIGEGDYLNCPLTEAEYDAFYDALMSAERADLRKFEKPRFFEGCLPIEVMAERGRKTLTFGPMKPVGLTDPRTGSRPYAVLQLRRENASATLYNLVGFQTRLKRPAQGRVLRMIPGLERAEFARWGSVHRNTFIHAPTHLTGCLSLKARPTVFLAGQVSGVEGYVESAAMGILAGENAARLLTGRPLVSPPPTTAMGGLVAHLTDLTARNFQPSNINFGLMAPVPPNVRKKDRRVEMVRRAREDMKAWLREVEGEYEV